MVVCVLAWRTPRSAPDQAVTWSSMPPTAVSRPFWGDEGAGVDRGVRRDGGLGADRVTRELERGLQRDCGISKAEFSVLVTLWRTTGREMRVGELSESLDWDKSRVSHQLTRMEKRGFVKRTQYGADGRR